MSKTVGEVKLAVGELVVSLKNGLKRELAYNKELATDRAMLAHLIEQRDSEAVIPVGNPHGTWDNWIVEIEKQIKSGESSIARIEIDKCEVAAFEYYIANATEQPPTP
ncbi:hypothetical protein SAMN02745174_02388 [Cetobacterium ceti]|uniref:Uncharacterized protein n=1 Tax=Cetobacterium ceti TaxID=180163 RepID=A0A1T4QNF0_9FUSO|nr:hypothetical protein [Cetobacterium ceti]SKA05224.1 hypothetical protein SAMN02745174_02388 [Cetobacterium ceti]